MYKYDSCLSAGTGIDYVVLKIKLKGGNWDQRRKFQSILQCVPIMYCCKAEGIASKDSRSRGGTKLHKIT